MGELSELDKEEYLPDGSHRCQALNNDGDQCSRASVPGSRYCWQHQPSSEAIEQNNKFDKERKRELLKKLEEGEALSRGAAAQAVEISPSTLRRHTDPDSPQYDPRFDKLLDLAVWGAVRHLEKQAVKLAEGSWKETEKSRKPDREMIIFLLCNLTSKHDGYVFHKGSKQQILQMQGGNGKSEEDMSDEEAREQLADIIGMDPDELDKGIESSKYVDAEFET